MNLKLLLEELIKEEWKDMVKSKYDSYSIYKNPTLKDYKEIDKESEYKGRFRYIIKLYGDPVLYVFSSDITHPTVTKKLNIPYKNRVHLPVWGDYGFGISELESGKLKLSNGIMTEIKRMGKRAPMDFIEEYFI